MYTQTSQVQAAIQAASKRAIIGAGLSDYLFSLKMANAVESIAANTAPEIKAECQTLFEKYQGYEEEFDADTCILTGIESECCPCGQHG